MKKTNNILSKGFTLIELLVVIAVLGVLASAILLAIDPVEQLARGRDSGLKGVVTEGGLAMVAYQTAHTGVPVTTSSGDTAFLTTLKTAGDIRIVPADRPVDVNSCVAAANKSKEAKLCYNYNSAVTVNAFVIFGTPESKSVKSICTGTDVAWYVYSSAAGRAGVVCTADTSTEPAPGLTSFLAP